MHSKISTKLTNKTKTWQFLQRVAEEIEPQIFDLRCLRFLLLIPGAPQVRPATGRRRVKKLLRKNA